MTHPEADVGLAFRRACCPVCHRRGRAVTVGFGVEGHGFYKLTRRPQDEEPEEEEEEEDVVNAAIMTLWQHYGASYISDEAFRPPIWRGSSTRMPPELDRSPGPVTSCRYGHQLRVPPKAEIDRMLKRIRSDRDVVYLPALRGASM